ncbi:hypothetical protein I302_106685 [Kwoniella bestiolae CBS 10118]|uniref:Leucine-rich repeat-containing N-terminal plant-type domain-containing protein n=1 Tax=Kwoniella bestiolae CBS 10118 TaxID=1296100 RepID=A0A1B9G0P5_9TREE|nr:hypothetical protein I302_06053 [Kwoniella bestiolae CBS 10118]OCF24592.1 hypothetical protein I302_06053 [Kwoniella bestiolae CBS 10118]
MGFKSNPNQTKIPLNILFTILLFLSLQSSISALNLSFLPLSAQPRSISPSSANIVPQKQYLSSSKRISQPKRFGYFSFSRHPRSLPSWNPLEGIEGVLVHRGVPSQSHSQKSKLQPESASGIPPQPEDVDAQVEEQDDGEEEMDSLVERDEDGFILEDCERRQDLGDPSLVAQLGTIPEQEVQAAQSQIQSDLNANANGQLDISLNPESDTGDRKHNDKILWSGLESLLPLEKGIIKRHRDKSDRHGYSGGGEGGYGSGRKGKHGIHGGDGEDEDGVFGSSGGRGKGYENGKHGGGYDGSGDGRGRHQGGWSDPPQSHGNANYPGGWKNGKGRPNWHDTDKDNGNNKYQQDWERPSSHNYGSESNSDTNGNDQGWNRPNHSYNDGSRNGNGNPKWDDGMYHPWSNAHSDPNPDGNGDWSDSNSNSWNHHPSSSSSDWSHNSSPDDHPWHTNGAGQTSQGGLSSQSTPSLANNHNSDCIKLSKFYKSSQEDGPGWTKHSGWSSSWDDAEDCCTWFGVTCDPISRRVTALNLRGNGLEGDLGSGLFGLDALMRLDLSQNPLSSLPNTFNALTKLTHLNISTSGLSSSIPNSILSSPSIINLDLSNNELTGAIRLSSSAAMLRSIDLSHNRLTSLSISPVGMGNLGKIVLSNNNLAGELPDLSGLKSLQSLDVSYNNTGPLFDLSSLTNLTRLDVRSNQLTGSFPPLPPSIQSLYLSSNLFSGPIPSIPPPSTLDACYILPNAFSPCPSKEELSNPDTIASKCHLRTCGQQSSTSTAAATTTGGTTIDASQVTTLPNSQKGIPVNPLPGENLNSPAPGGGVQGKPQVISSNDWPGLKNTQNQNQNQLPQSQRLGQTKLSSLASITINGVPQYTLMTGVFIASFLLVFQV